MNSLLSSSSIALNSALNNILAFILVSYSLFCSKVADASSYLQEQAELYFIVTKFILEQAIPRINPLTTLLICIQAASIATILYAVISRLRARLHVNKKIKVNVGVQMEEIELVRVRRERAPTAQQSNQQDAEPTSKIQTKSILADSKDQNKTQSLTLAATAPLMQAPLSYSEKAKLFYSGQNSPATLKAQPVINIRKGPSYAQKARLFYEQTQAKQRQEEEDELIRKEQDLSRPKPDITDILDALTEFDRKVAVVLRSEGHKEELKQQGYFSGPSPISHCIRL